MNVRTIWSRLTSPSDGVRRGGPTLLLLLFGGGSLVLLLVVASRFRQIERIPLAVGVRHTSEDFSAAQAAWKKQGLDGARFTGGVIQVPAEAAEQYRNSWNPATESDGRSRWADVWQQANERLGQFSGSREREAAREISRAQVVSRLLEELPDIAMADLVWDEAPRAGWREPERVRATVYLHAAAGRTIGPDVVDAVRKAVSGSKANLALEDVTVMDQSRMITYGGTDATASEVRAAQLVALFQNRLKGAVEHVPGTRIQIHANSSAGADDAAVPVTVSVGVPESAVWSLAQVENRTDDNGSSDTGTRKRREVFRSVEQHIHQSIASKVAQLIPPGLMIAAPEQVMIETLPSPVVPTEPKPVGDRQLLTAWLQKHAFVVIAIICGLGAVSMLWPRRVRMATSIDVAKENRLETAAERTQEQRSVTMPPAAAVPLVMETQTTRVTETAPGTATEVVHPVGDAKRSAATVQAAPDSQPKPTVRTDLLRDVLARLDQQREPAEPAHPADTSESDPKVAHTVNRRLLSARQTTTGLQGVAVESFDLEQLSNVRPVVLREIVGRIEVDVWSRALFGASSALRERILPCLPLEDAERVSAALQSPRPIRLREIDAAQARVRSVWDQLRQDQPIATSPAARTAPERSAA